MGRVAHASAAGRHLLRDSHPHPKVNRSTGHLHNITAIGIIRLRFPAARRIAILANGYSLAYDPPAGLTVERLDRVWNNTPCMAFPVIAGEVCKDPKVTCSTKSAACRINIISS